MTACQEINADLAAERDQLRAEQSIKVERSTQFINMRQMLAKKNVLVRQLRDQLRTHGISADDVDAVDE